MQLHHLRYFVTVAEELSYRAAADRLRISKPTLSKQIQVLERQLRHQLLVRPRHPVVLTPAGEALLHHARKVLQACDQLREAVSDASAGQVPLRVRVANGIQHVLKAELRAVEDDDSLLVDFALTSGPDAEEAVASGRADAAVIWLPTGYHSTLHAQPLAAADVCLAVHQDHRLADQDPVAVSELVDEQIALFPRAIAPAVWDVFAAHLMPEGPRPGQVVGVTTGLVPMLSMLELVAGAQAVAPFVHEVARALALPEVRLQRLDPGLTLPMTLVCRQPNRPEVRKLMDMLA